MSKPIMQRLNECMPGRSIVNIWERLGLYLPGIDQTDINIMKRNSCGDVVVAKSVPNCFNDGMM